MQSISKLQHLSRMGSAQSPGKRMRPSNSESFTRSESFARLVAGESFTKNESFIASADFLDDAAVAEAEALEHKEREQLNIFKAQFLQVDAASFVVYLVLVTLVTACARFSRYGELDYYLSEMVRERIHSACIALHRIKRALLLGRPSDRTHQPIAQHVRSQLAPALVPSDQQVLRAARDGPRLARDATCRPADRAAHATTRIARTPSPREEVAPTARWL